MDAEEKQILEEANVLRARELDLVEQRIEKRHEIVKRVIGGVIITPAVWVGGYHAAQADLPWAAAFMAVSVLITTGVFVYAANRLASIPCKAKLWHWGLLLACVFVTVLQWPVRGS